MTTHPALLDAAYHSLADPTRRAVIRRLAHGPAAVSELAEPFAIGLPAFLKHLRVLEDAGLVTSEKIGRVRMCRLEVERVAFLEGWLAEQRALWRARADRLAAFVESDADRENSDGE